jgi:hypothetical protein
MPAGKRDERVAVDFYREGDVLAAVRTVNGAD